jgi:hypothetical protein
MARVIALMALAALGLTEASVHEPVHDHYSERRMSTTERYHAPREIRRSGRLAGMGVVDIGRSDLGVRCCQCQTKRLLMQGYWYTSCGLC